MNPLSTNAEQCLWITFYCASSRLHFVVNCLLQHIHQQSSCVTFAQHISIFIHHFPPAENKEFNTLHISQYKYHSLNAKQITTGKSPAFPSQIACNMLYHVACLTY